MNTKRCGFVVMDVILGMAIVTTLMVLLAVAVQKQRQASLELADQRRAARELEAVMATLQHGGPAPNPQPPQTVSINVLPDLAPIDGYVWVRLSTRGGRAEVDLTGLVPRDQAVPSIPSEIKRP